MQNVARAIRWTALPLVAVAGLFAGFGGCAMQPSGNTVTMINLEFSPQTIRVTAGELVTWRNREGLPIQHTVTSGNPGDNDAGALFNSPVIDPGESWSYRFETPGTFIYFCEIHPDTMRNAIVIVDPAN